MSAALRQLARALRVRTERVGVRPLEAMDWLPHQAAFLACTDKRKLLRTGNRLGKTTVGAAESIHYAMGTHPADPGVVIPEQWVLTASWSQSLAAQERLWSLAPKDALAPGQTYNKKTGFGQHNPMLAFANGSVIRVRTTQQDALDLAGFQVGRIWFDEPPKSQAIWDECLARTRTAGGRIVVTFTPINQDISYIRDLAAKGSITDLHFPMTADAFIHTKSGRVYRTDDGIPCTAEWIEQERAEALPHTVPVRFDGEWETKTTDRYFEAFVGVIGEGSHIGMPEPGATLTLCLGMDHGTGRGNQATVLVGLLEQQSGYPTVYVMDEAGADAATTPEQDAENITNMLARHGWQWSDLDYTYGDIPAGTGAARKGNRDIEDALRRIAGLRSRDDLRPRLRVAKRGRNAGAGSVEYGAGWLHKRMVGRQFFVDPRCERLIDSLNKWDGTKRTEDKKHFIDALRYACTAQIRRGPGMGHAPSSVLMR